MNADTQMYIHFIYIIYTFKFLLNWIIKKTTFIVVKLMYLHFTWF